MRGLTTVHGESTFHTRRSMTKNRGGPVDLYDGTYSGFQEEVRARIRRETFGEDLGQNSWLLADELREFISWLQVGVGSSVLEIAVGSGGPALFIAEATGARVCGIDINESGIAAATRQAEVRGLGSAVRFVRADASQELPFADASFEAVICNDSINHLPDRRRVLKEVHRVLRPAGRLLYTDPVVVTGPISSEEIAARSSIGFFVFHPAGENERLLAECDFLLLRAEDRTGAVAEVSGRWRDSRARWEKELLELEGEETFLGLQRFLETVFTLSHERRLSRYAYLATRPKS